MRIYKRNEIYWLDARDEGCGRYSLKTTNKKIAEKIMAQKQLEFLEGIHEVKLHREERKIIRLEDAIDKYIESIEDKIKPKTLASYKQCRQNLLNYFNNATVDEIKLIDAEKFQSKRLQSRKPATVNRDMQLLKAVFNKLKMWGDIKTDPLESLGKLKEDNIRTRILKDKELELLKSNLSSMPDYLRLAIVISLHTGMRKGEILSLQLPAVKKKQKEKVNWVDLEERLINLNVTKHGSRQVPINDHVYAEICFFIKSISTEQIFSMKDFKKTFNTNMRKIGIEDFTFHDLRRTFISRCAMQGYSREMIQSIVGQVSESVYKRYAHFSQESKLKLLQEYGTNLAQQ